MRHDWSRALSKHDGTPVSKSNRRPFDSAEVRFAQDDRFWGGVRGGTTEAVPFYKAFAGPFAKSNRRSLDSAEVRFAQDDRWFGGGGDFARLRRVD